MLNFFINLGYILINFVLSLINFVYILIDLVNLQNFILQNRGLTMSNLSLLVDCNKIIKWLEQRKKLNKDWYNYVKAAQQKLKLLLKQQDEYIKYPSVHEYLTQNSQNFCYFDLNKFVELLLKTQMAQQKSLLFGYADKKVKQWTNLKKFMDNKNVGLLNNAKFIQQSLKFDLPDVDKSISMMDDQLVNLKRKIDFNENTIFQQQNQMKKQISTVGIQITNIQNLRRLNIESQIPQIIRKTPETIKIIQNLILSQKVQTAYKIYKNKVQKDNLKCQLSLLEHFYIHKNDYVQVFRDKSEQNNYNDDLKYKQFENWKPVNQWEITIEGFQGNQIKEIKLNYTTLIEDRQTRQILVYNLNQLLYFFKGLKYESSQVNKNLKVDNDCISMTQNQMQQIINKLTSCISKLNQKRLLTPLQLKNNKKSYQHFVAKFHNIQKNILTLSIQIQDYRKQIQNLQVQKNLLVDRLRTLRRKLIYVKKNQERLLTQFIGKEVKIVGEINKLQ